MPRCTSHVAKATAYYTTARMLKAGDTVLSTYNHAYTVESVEPISPGKLKLNLRGGLPWRPIVEETTLVVKQVECR